MIPFQTVTLIEELPDNADGKVVRFELVEAPESLPATDDPVEKESSDE